MLELAGAALGWLSALAACGAARLKRRRSKTLGNAGAISLFAASIAVLGMHEGWVAGSIIAVLAWTAAASVAPLLITASPRALALSMAIAIVAVAAGLIVGVVDA